MVARAEKRLPSCDYLTSAVLLAADLLTVPEIPVAVIDQAKRHIRRSTDPAMVYAVAQFAYAVVQRCRGHGIPEADWPFCRADALMLQRKLATFSVAMDDGRLDRLAVLERMLPR